MSSTATSTATSTDPTPTTNPAEKPDLRRARTPVPSTVDVAIIGSGLGGLCAGAYLARQGLRVACFEAHYVAGGCATQFQRGGKRDRYHFDVGLHYIGDCGEDGQIPRILRGVGAHVDYQPMDQDGFDTLVFPDFRFRIPADVDLYRTRLVEMFPRERRGIDRYVGFLRAVMSAGQKLDRADGRMSLRTLLSMGMDAVGLARVKSRTIGQVLDDCTQDARLRAVLLGQSGDYGLPPSEVSAVLHLGLAGHYFRGAYYPKGGGQVIADRLAEVIEQHGGTVHLRHPVERVLVENGAAVGLRLEPHAGDPAQEVRARAVLSNADLRKTMLDLVGPEHLPRDWIDRSRDFQMAAALFITFLGVNTDMRAKGMSATNYWQFDGYDVESWYREAGGASAAGGDLQTRACYITSASLKDPDHAAHHAPPGVTNLEVMTIVPGASARWTVGETEAHGYGYRHNDRYHALKASVEQQLVDRLDRLFPGSAAAIVYRESATPVTHARYTRATDGTGYGLAATPAQFLERRPGYRGPLKDLYLCGASTRAGHGIVGALMSGRQAARRIAANLGRPIASL